MDTKLHIDLLGSRIRGLRYIHISDENIFIQIKLPRVEISRWRLHGILPSPLFRRIDSYFNLAHTHFHESIMFRLKSVILYIGDPILCGKLWLWIQKLLVQNGRSFVAYVVLVQTLIIMTWHWLWVVLGEDILPISPLIVLIVAKAWFHNRFNRMKLLLVCSILQFVLRLRHHNTFGLNEVVHRQSIPEHLHRNGFGRAAARCRFVILI